MAEVNSSRTEQELDLPKSRPEAKARGSTYYFTGTPCKHGHLSIRQTTNGGCLKCVEARSKRPEHIDRVRESRKRTYQKYKDKKLEYGKKYRQENKERFVEWQREWREGNRDRYRKIQRAAQARRRAGMRGTSRAALDEWESSQPKLCYWCGVGCAESYHLDHFVPLARGGEHAVDNLVIACPPCNLRKSSRDPYEFAASIGKVMSAMCEEQDKKDFV